ncbi:MAG: GlsB/YeaQ/YmgE family stress response membrane protein [Actinobacteria bacterium]|nr:GlsB/YeaQ/YmgE family stress response membrane protein [Actinomycetota bacterium]
MDNLLVLIIVGAVIGVLARLLMPGSNPIGIIGTIVVGIVGAIIGGYLWKELFGNTEGVEWIGGIIVAMALLWLYRKFTYNSSGRRTAL